MHESVCRIHADTSGDGLILLCLPIVVVHIASGAFSRSDDTYVLVDWCHDASRAFSYIYTLDIRDHGTRMCN